MYDQGDEDLYADQSSNMTLRRDHGTDGDSPRIYSSSTDGLPAHVQGAEASSAQHTTAAAVRYITTLLESNGLHSSRLLQHGSR